MKYLSTIVCYCNAVILSIFVLTSCESKNDDDISNKEMPIYVYNAPCITWGASKTFVKKQMDGFKLLHEDEHTLIYNGNQTEDLISYGFDSNKLFVTNVFIQCEKATTEDIKQSFIGYLPQVGYNETTYLNEEKETIGEITTIDKDGIN